MKKISAVLILLILIFITPGCGARTTYHIQDAVTGMPVSGKTVINGKSMEITNGTISLSTDKIAVEKTGYKKAVSNGNKIIKLEPIAFLDISTNFTPEEIYIDKTKYPVFFGGNNIVISPVVPGKHKILFKGKFIKDAEINKTIYEGKNTINVSFSLNKKNIKLFLSSMKFPEEIKNAKEIITIKGKLDGEDVYYTFNVILREGKIVQITDKNINYKFIDGAPVIIEGDETYVPVKDKEKTAALIYARNIIKNILNMREMIKPLDIIGTTDSNIMFSADRNFENRKFTENISVYFNEGMVNKTEISIKSPIENADLDITMLIKEIK